MGGGLRPGWLGARSRFQGPGEVQNGPIGARFPTVRQSAALSVAVLATEAVVSGLTLHGPGAAPLFGRLRPPELPEVHILSALMGLTLLATAPRLWRGTRTAVPLTIAGLIALAALSCFKGHYADMAIQACLAGLLALGRGAFALGCRNRPGVTVVSVAAGAWGLAFCALKLAPLVPGSAGHAIGHVLPHTVSHALRIASPGARLNADWTTLIEALLACALLTSALALRSALRPAPWLHRHYELEDRAAREIVEHYGSDSLSPFVLRPDKALAFAAGGLLSFRLIGGTAVVSSDPVAAEGAAPEVLGRFLEVARRRGWRVVVWGASARHLEAYGGLGMHAVCAGEEAVVAPRTFTLEGRAVRKLRQSVNRVARRGWEVQALEGRQVDSDLEAEIDALEADWRSRQQRLLGFAMGMGGFETEMRAGDLYVIARSPEGHLGAVMRFAEHRGNLSLDTMRRARETPNGLNEALVARALSVARERGVEEVSLNYAGLAHLVRDPRSRGRASRWLTRVAMAPLYRRFQMERLVRFNEKFSPEWRPRYLVCESRAAIPGAVMRVLQAEGYLPERRRRLLPRLGHMLPDTLPGSPQAKSAG